MSRIESFLDVLHLKIFFSAFEITFYKTVFEKEILKILSTPSPVSVRRE